MEYISMTQTEALKKCDEFNHLVDKEYVDKESKQKCVVIAIIALPSQSEELRKMCEYMAVNFRGIDMTTHMEKLLSQYSKDEFTVLAVSRTYPLTPAESLVPAGYLFLPLQYLADQNGELHLGFGL